MKPKNFHLPSKLLLAIWLWQLMPNAISAQTTPLERRPFIQTQTLELQITDQKDSIIRLPNGMMNTLYCFSFKLDVPSGTNANQWRIDFMLAAEYYGLFSSTPINYLLPRQNPVLEYQADNGVLNFSFRPDITGSFNFMLVMTHENGRKIYHPRLFKIEVQPYSPLKFEVYVGNTRFNGDKIMLQPNENTTLKLKLSNSSGNLSWNVRLKGFRNRLSITEESPQYRGGEAEYSWTLGYPALTPAQLGHEDTLAFIPLSCNLEPWSPDQPSGGNPIYTIYIQAPSAKVAPQPPRSYPKNQLPGGIAGHNYEKEDVTFELVPKGANFTDYTDWQLINMDGRQRYTNGPLSLEGNRTGPHRLIGAPTEAAYGLPIKVVAIKKSPTTSDTIASDVFYLTICGHDFDEVSEEYEVVDLGALLPMKAKTSAALKVSNSGYVVGYYTTENQELFNVMWYQDNLLKWRLIELPSTVPGDNRTNIGITDINDKGGIVGGSSIKDPNWKLGILPPPYQNIWIDTPPHYGLKWDRSNTNRMSWQMSKVFKNDLHLFKINNRSESLGNPFGKILPYNSFSGSVTGSPLTQLFNLTSESKQAITGGIISDFNDNDNMVGYSVVYRKKSASNVPYINDTLFYRPFFSDTHRNKIEEIFPFSNESDLGKYLYIPVAMNNHNVILANRSSLTFPDLASGTVIKKVGNQWKTFFGKALLPLQNKTTATATSINDLNQAVGYYYNAGFQASSFLVDGRLMDMYSSEPTFSNKYKWTFDVNKQIKGNYKIQKAYDINNAGWIAGDGVRGAILLKPKNDYQFILFDQIPKKINNRSQIILQVHENLIPINKFSLWEECVGDITPPDGKIYDINDDMIGVGDKKSWQRKGATGAEHWVAYSLPGIENFIPQKERDEYNTVMVQLNGINNANEIVGQVLQQKKSTASSSGSTATIASGIVWHYADDRANEVPKGEQVKYYFNRSLVDFNSSGIAITGLRENVNYVSFPFRSSGGVFDTKKNINYDFDTGGYLSQLSDINDAGIAVGLINVPCGGLEERGFMAIPPYTLNTHFREFCGFYPSGINNQGWVVGQQDMKAMVYIPDFPGSLNGTFVDLNLFLSETDRLQWRLIGASGINDKREVIGIAMKLDKNGVTTGAFKGFMLNIDYKK